MAYTPSPAAIVRLVLIFVFVHFLASSLIISTLAYFLMGRLLGPGVAGLPRRRRQGLFGQVEGADQLEFGYCFDVGEGSSGTGLESMRLTPTQVSIRAFFPVWVVLYVVQFLLMPLISRDYW